MRAEAYLRGVDVAVAIDQDWFDDLFEEVSAAVTQNAQAVEPQQMTSAPNADGGRTVDGGGPPLTLKLVPYEAPGIGEAPRARVLKSEIDKVSDAAWTKFVTSMRTASTGSVSSVNAMGAWEMRPKRLADLGLVKNVRPEKGPSNSTAWRCEFVAPLTQKIFLENAGVQYRVFAASMRRYVAGLRDGSIDRPKNAVVGLTLSGMLAVLHRCGPGGLKTWGDMTRRFGDTIALVERVNGVF